MFRIGNLKVAIFEPEPRICGVTQWAWQVRDGFRAIVDRCDIVSVTKSGKTSKRWGGDCAETTKASCSWWTSTPDVVVKIEDAAEVLDGYDLVLLTEPKCAPHDRDAKKLGTVPAYVRVLAATKTPWTTVLHGDQYDAKRAVWVEDLLNTRSFCGTVITRAERYLNDRFEGVDHVVWSRLPYTPRRLMSDPPSTAGRSLGIHGRVVPNKGHMFAAGLIDRYPPGWDLQIFGPCPTGRGPNMTYLLYEHFSKWEGWRGEHSGDNCIRAFPWWVERDGRRVIYHGSFEDVAEVFSTISVHLNLTSWNFANTQEYTSLEAMDFGCVPVYQRAAHEDGYEAVILEKFREPAGISNKGQIRMEKVSDEVIDDVVRSVERACSLVEGPGFLDLVEANRLALREHNDPADFARFVLEVV